MDQVPQDNFTVEKQEARCYLRERFLRAVGSIIGKDATFEMYSNTTVTGVFKGSDIEFRNLLVENLETPTGKISNSILRSSDIICMNINKIIELS